MQFAAAGFWGKGIYFADRYYSVPHMVALPGSGLTEYTLTVSHRIQNDVRC
jgi:hypothetical protein